MTTRTQSYSACPTPFSDHVFKTVQEVDVPLRIWPATEGQGKRPWLLWWHGGGFTAGKHVIPNAWVIPAFRARGYHVVSAAYRFLPHVNLDDMIEDANDAHIWCRENLPQILGADNVDVDALVVGGDSAGGTMSTLAGINLNPSPRVVVDVYGVTDATDPHFTGRGVDTSTPQQSFFLSGKFTEEEIFAALAETDARKAQHIVPWTWELEPAMSVETLRSFWGVPDFQVTPEHTLRMDMLAVLDRDRKLFRHLARRHDVDEDKKLDADPDALDKLLLNYSSMHLIDVKGSYPPTFFMHGEVDQVVPVEHSRNMAKKLTAMGVPVGEVYSPDGNHCFENVIEEPTDAGWDEYVVPCLDFIDKHIWSA